MTMDHAIYTLDHMETACAIWEDMLERRVTLPLLDDAWGNYGTCAMRTEAATLAVYACQVWATMTLDEMDVVTPYDWEFIPSLINRVEWDPETGSYDDLPEPRAMADSILKGRDV
jgi:hypothetical protein